MMAPRPPAEHWTIDKRIPIAFLVGIVVQTAVAGWYVSKLDSRTTVNEAKIEKLERTDSENGRDAAALESRTTRLEVDYTASKGEVARRLDNIDDKLDRLLDAWRSPPTRSEFAPANRAP